MSGAVLYKHYAGPFNLYLLLDQLREHKLHQPPFLERNIRQALNGHDQELRILQSKSRGVRQNPESEPHPVMQRRKANAWTPPAREDLEPALNIFTQLLRIVPKRIRSSTVEGEAFDVCAASLEGPDWLRDANSFSVKCQVVCILYNQDERLSAVRAQLGDLKAIMYGSGKFGCDIALQEPFIFDHKEIWKPSIAETTTSGGPSSARYVVKIKIRFISPDDASRLLSRLDDTFSPQGLSLEEMTLQVKWPGLTHVPPEETVAKLQRKVDHKWQPIDDLVMHVDLAWSDCPQAKSPLELCNLAARNQLGEESRPSAQLPMATKPPEYHLNYSYTGEAGGTRNITRTDLKCVFCRSRPPWTTFDTLHAHYNLSHTLFSFSVRDGPSQDGVVSKGLDVKNAEKPRERASNHLPDEREIHWVAPPQPFDWRRYFRSEETDPRLAWTQAARPGAQRKYALGVGTTSQRPTSSSGAVDLPRRRPEDVKPLPPRKRKLYRVPDVPGVQLYRLTSKRFLEVGEELSESDDDVDMSWHKLQHEHRIPQFHKAARSVIALLDDYLMDQNTYNCYLGDEIIRFTRQHKEQLATPDQMKAFSDKLQELQESGLLHRDDSAYCSELVKEEHRKREADHSTTTTEHGERHADSPNASAHREKRPRHEDDRQTLKQEIILELKKILLRGNRDTCKCGIQPDDGFYGIALCCMPGCLNPSGFHLKCVGLQKPEDDWLCPGCTTSGQVAKELVAWRAEHPGELEELHALGILGV